MYFMQSECAHKDIKNSLFFVLILWYSDIRSKQNQRHFSTQTPLIERLMIKVMSVLALFINKSKKAFRD